METQVLIDGIKKALRLKGVNYDNLAKEMGISERSVSRIFTEGTLSVDRLLKICEVLGVSLKGFLDLMDLEHEHRDSEFTVEQEKFLSQNLQYGFFYVLLYEYDSPQEIAKEFNLDNSTVTKILSKLDELQLLEWLPGDKVKLRPRKWVSPNGLVLKTHTNWFTEKFIEDSLSASKDKNILMFPNLSEKSQEKLKTKLQEFAKEVRKEMEMEGILGVPTKMSCLYLGLRPVDFLYDELKGFKA